MINPQELIVQLEKEAASYPDGSYSSNLALETCIVIRSLIQDVDVLKKALAEHGKEAARKYKPRKKGAK